MRSLLDDKIIKRKLLRARHEIISDAIQEYKLTHYNNTGYRPQQGQAKADAVNNEGSEGGEGLVLKQHERLSRDAVDRLPDTDSRAAGGRVWNIFLYTHIIFIRETSIAFGAKSKRMPTSTKCHETVLCQLGSPP